MCSYRNKLWQDSNRMEVELLTNLGIKIRVPKECDLIKIVKLIFPQKKVRAVILNTYLKEIVRMLKVLHLLNRMLNRIKGTSNVILRIGIDHKDGMEIFLILMIKLALAVDIQMPIKIIGNQESGILTKEGIKNLKIRLGVRLGVKETGIQKEKKHLHLRHFGMKKKRMSENLMKTIGKKKMMAVLKKRLLNLRNFRCPLCIMIVLGIVI